MPEKQPLDPEVAQALRAYEIEIRDGTERSQKEALERLRRAQQQRHLGLAAALAATEPNTPPESQKPETLAG